MTERENAVLVRNRWTGSAGYQCTYGYYTPSQQPLPVPPFPCPNNPQCCSENRLCDSHVRILFVRYKFQENDEDFFGTIEIPFGNWECWGWYAERIEESLGIPVSDQRLIFAGVERLSEPHRRSSGLQRLSTILLIRKILK